MLSDFVDVKVLCFYDDNVGACKIQDLFITNLRKEFKNVKFERVNAQKEKELTEKYGINEIPSVVIENDGQVKEKFSGLTQELFLRKAIERVKQV